MTRFLLIILAVIFTLNAHSQSNEGVACESLIINDSLSNLQSDSYNFSISNGFNVQSLRRDNIRNIHQVISIEEDCLKFRISYACGCGDNEKQLVSNGILLQDNQGRQYFEIKFLFVNHNNHCEALCHDILSYNISQLKDSSTTVFLKFDGFEELMEF